jgi:hypothetical protein
MKVGHTRSCSPCSLPVSVQNCAYLIFGAPISLKEFIVHLARERSTNVGQRVSCQTSLWPVEQELGSTDIDTSIAKVPRLMKI